MFTCESVCVRIVDLLQCAYFCVLGGKGRGDCAELKKINLTLVYFKIYSSGGDGGGGFVFHSKTVIIV